MTAKPPWTLVCQLEDIVPNTGVCAKVGAEQVAVFRVVSPSGEEDGVFAISNHDPKSGANVLSRGLVGDIEGLMVVASPVYKNHLCLKTGKCIEDDSFSVKSYPVRVSDEGTVLVGEA